MPNLHLLLTTFGKNGGMPNYRRLRVRGGTYFFTLALAQRGSTLLTDHVDLLRSAYWATGQEMPMTTEAIVILPDHLHAVWTLPEDDDAFPERWRRITARFTHVLEARFPRSPSKHAKREAGVWQRRYWEHLIKDQADFDTHVEYCWANPVRHGFCETPGDWTLSSIHRDARAGRVPAGWQPQDVDGTFGEVGGRSRLPVDRLCVVGEIAHPTD